MDLRDGDLETARFYYVGELRYAANLKSNALIRALSEVPRERYLGPGPWQIYNLQAGSYWVTPDNNPRHLYHNVLVAIDARRKLNNGLPSALAYQIEALNLQPNDHVVHIGCGTGYYTAIMAHLVGITGRVSAFEVDGSIAEQAIANLRPLAQVTAIRADGSQQELDPADAILVNAGTTHPLPEWLNKLRVGGRLLFPLTSTGNFGAVLKVEKSGGGLSASFIMPITIFPCTGARDPKIEQALGEAFRKGLSQLVRSLRTDQHTPSESCWMHCENYCLSLEAN
jgi:protein-L-isoaspartate(D-aspartate) O-methyltransferase